MIIREYQLDSGSQEQVLDMPAGAKIMNLDRTSEGRMRLSVALNEKERARELRTFKCFTSGASISSAVGFYLMYIGSINLLPTLWHVFELIKLPPAPPEELEPEPVVELTPPAPPALLEQTPPAPETNATVSETTTPVVEEKPTVSETTAPVAETLPVVPETPSAEPAKPTPAPAPTPEPTQAARKNRNPKPEPAPNPFTS